MYVAARVVIQEYHVMFTYRFGLCDHTPTRVGQMGRPNGLGHKGRPNNAVYYGM